MGTPASADMSRADRIYDLHGLVEVTIARDVQPEIVRRIELQIGAFHAVSERSSPPPRRIWIGPYAVRTSERPGSDVEAIFHDGRGIPGKRFEEPGTRLAVASVDRGLVVHAGYSNVPINVYVQVLLAPQGYSMVHAAAYQSSSGTVNVLAGAGGVGKTSVIGYAVRARGLRYLGDELATSAGLGSASRFPAPSC